VGRKSAEQETSVQQVDKGYIPEDGNIYIDWIFHGFPQFLQTNAKMLSRIRPWPLPSTYFPVHQPQRFTACGLNNK
jgi:hypothetical protein